MKISNISYLFVSSEKPDDQDHISISYEIITDMVNSPRYNFYEFKRSLPGVISSSGGLGVLDESVISKDNKEFSIIESLLSSKTISIDLEKFIQDKIVLLHRKTISEINDEDKLLNHICRYEYNHSGIHKNPGIKIQVCIETSGNSTSDLLNPKKFREVEKNDHRLYTGGKYLSWFGHVTDIGKIEAPKEVVKEIEYQKLIEIIIAKPNIIFEKLINNYWEFSRENLDLFIKFAPNPEDKKSSRDYTEVLMIRNFFRNIIENNEFLSVLRFIEIESRKTLAEGLDVEEHEDAYHTLKNIEKLTGKDLDIYSVIFNRLKSDGDSEIQANCIKIISSTLEYYSEKFESIELSVSLICTSCEVRKILSNSQILQIFLHYSFEITSRYIENIEIIKEMENSSEFINLTKQIDRCKAGDEAKLISRIPKMIERKEYNKSMFLLNACFPHLFFSNSAADMAEMYVECLLVIDGERAVKLIEQTEILIQRIPTLSLMIDYLLESGNHKGAIVFLQRMRRIEPNSELTKLVEQKINRSKFIDEISDKKFTPEGLQELTGVEFEKLLKKRFIDMGFSAIETPVTGDYGADLIIEDRHGTRYIVQCKRFSAKVNLKAVQEVVGALSHYAGDYGIVITNNQFLPSAIKLAASNNIELWDGSRLMSFFAGEIDFSVISEAEI